MRIIERREPEIPTKRIRCKYCGSLFEFEMNECRATEQLAIMHDGLGSKNIDCPVCKRTSYFEWEDE